MESSKGCVVLRAGAIFSIISTSDSTSSNKPSSLSSSKEFEKSTSTGLFGSSDFFSRTGLMAVG